MAMKQIDLAVHGSYAVYTVQNRRGKGFWMRLGEALLNRRNETMEVELAALPINKRLVLRSANVMGEIAGPIPFEAGTKLIATDMSGGAILGNGEVSRDGHQIELDFIELPPSGKLIVREVSA